jgi:ABC-type multidrug transport system fused ATPase/permease subunit
MVLSSVLKLSGPYFLRFAIDLGLAEGSFANVNLFGALFVGAALLSFVSLRSSTLLTGVAGEKVLQDLRVATFDHLTGLSLGFFERQRSGRLISRITSDVEAVERLVTDSLVRIVTEVLFLVGAAVVLLTMDIRLALAAMGVMPVMILLTIWFRRRSERVFLEVRERIASVLSFIQETLRGMQVVQAFATERARTQRFQAVNDDWADANVTAHKIEALFFPSMQFLGSVGTAIVLIYGGGRILAGDLSPGVLAAFVVYLTLFFEPMNHLSELYSQLQQALAGLAKMAHLLEVEPEITDVVGSVDLPDVEGLITFEDVHFSYSPSGPMVLQDINMRIEPGQTAALVGPTGAGKSTIVKLLARFYDPTQGSLRIDGFEVGKVTVKSLRRQLALVPQEGFLFGGTIADNLRFGKPDATNEQVEEICRRIDIHDFIATLPEGYQTEVRERGARLAAGEKQLIALARALLADPRLVILDEATSSLDSATEYRVERAFSSALQGRTSVVIAHRLSTVMNADVIFVVDGGRIVEQGDHFELVTRGGRYSALYLSWLAVTDGDTAAI